MVSRILIGLVMTCIPGATYYYKGFEYGVMAALTLLILLLINATEEIREIREYQQKIKNEKD